MDSYKETKSRLNQVRGSMFTGGPRRSIKLNKTLANELEDILGTDDDKNSSLNDKTIDLILSSKTKQVSDDELD